MRNTGKLLVLLMLAALYCGCQSVTFSPKVDSLLTKMRKAKDPQGKLNSINTAVIKGEFKSDEKNKPMTMELDFKRPDKLKVEVVVPGKTAFVTGFDGKTGWVYRAGKGVEKLEGRKLNQVKLQAQLLAPGADLSRIFKSIELKGTSQEVGEKCYKFVCIPKDEFQLKPITFYVSQKTMMVVKRVETQVTSNGADVELTTIFTDYQPVDGIMVARDIVSLRGGQLMEFNVKSVKWNEPVDDSSFTLPKKCQ